MSDKKKPKLKPNAKFAETVEILANTPPVSNKEIVKRLKDNKKK